MSEICRALNNFLTAFCQIENNPEKVADVGYLLQQSFAPLFDHLYGKGGWEWDTSGPGIDIIIKQAECRKCGYRWRPRKSNPKFCPRCKQYIA